jgi:hypothetical protein
MLAMVMPAALLVVIPAFRLSDTSCVFQIMVQVVQHSTKQ